MLNSYTQGFIIPGAILVNWIDGNDETVDVVVTGDGDVAKMVPVGSGNGGINHVQVALDNDDIVALVEFMIVKFGTRNVLELSAIVGGEVVKRLGEGMITKPEAVSLESAIRKAYPGYLERVWDTKVVTNDEPEEVA